LKAVDIADLIIYKCQVEGVTHSKLQKLLYYAQGFHLALHNKPLFQEPIIASPTGATVQEIQERYGKYSYDPIPVHKKIEWDNDNLIHQVIHDVCVIFKPFNPKDIERLIKTETPWIKARTGRGDYDKGTEFNLSDLKDYISKEYVEQPIR